MSSAREPVTAPRPGRELVSEPSGSPDELAQLVARVPEGWSIVVFNGHRYALTKTTRVGGRSVTMLAEELGGPDAISANIYRTTGADLLKSCEMPDRKVLAFLRGWTLQ